jgi:type IV secretory pathway ATPase VirB11/archaellum biosynthesis ATPase
MLQATDGGNSLALKVLEPLAAYYAHDDVEEVVMNRAEEIWVKKRRSPWVRLDAPELTYDYIAKRVCRVLANINRARFDPHTMPVVSCELPGLPFRFQAVVGSSVSYELQDRQGLALAIRSLIADTSISMDTFVPRGVDLPGLQRLFDAIPASMEHIEKIKRAIDRGMSILVSGATSTGKTTFLNQVIRMIEDDSRIITVEDARELTVPQPNRVHFKVARNAGTTSFDYNACLDAIVRLTPDYVICGEVSVKNAASIYSVSGKGHPVLSTVHASTPDEALRAFVNNMAAAGSTLEPTSTLETLRQQIGCIIQLDRHGPEKRRQVVDITFPALAYQQRVAQEAGSEQGDARQ